MQQPHKALRECFIRAVSNMLETHDGLREDLPKALMRLTNEMMVMEETHDEASYKFSDHVKQIGGHSKRIDVLETIQK